MTGHDAGIGGHVRRNTHYIAGRTEEDLFPERRLKPTQWNKLGQFLLPPKHKVIRQTGYTAVQFNDGSYHFQDQFGRRPGSEAEHAREVGRAKQMRAELEAALKKYEANRRGAGGR